MSPCDACRVCGVQVGVSFDEPIEGSIQPWCEDHCPDHDYVYCRDDRTYCCIRCDSEPPHEWFHFDYDE